MTELSASHRMEYGQPYAVTATLSQRIEYSNLGAFLWVAIAPVPPNLNYQVCLELQFDVAPTGGLLTLQIERKTILDKREGRPILMIRADVTEKDQEHRNRICFQAVYQLCIRDCRLVAKTSSSKGQRLVFPLTPQEKQRYLKTETSEVQWHNSTFQNWLQKHNLRRKPQEAELSFASRLLRFMQLTMRATGNDNSDKSSMSVCIKGVSDCAGMANFFVAALRSANIAARTVFGRLAESARPGKEQYHVIAEFFVTGIGWIPLSPVYAVSDKQRKIEDVIGNLNRFIALGVGEDFVIPITKNDVWDQYGLQDIAYSVLGEIQPTPKPSTETAGWIVERRKPVVAFDLLM